eukprot:TRINITY_DN14821_c0_g1_i5.p1 TRINITY_DN14821_c0_g1~~TRINITY_DN14821_c0_g1_i5.p1  ORF type:complete len:131 (-),score=34.02 TRINITY_DN14821_c0_g1_i5:25-417(-)
MCIRDRCKKRFNSLKRAFIADEGEMLKKARKPGHTAPNRETIEIPDISQSDSRPRDSNVDELIDFLILARNAQRLTRISRLLEEIAMVNYRSFYAVGANRDASRVAEEGSQEEELENVLEFFEQSENSEQ